MLIHSITGRSCRGEHHIWRTAETDDISCLWTPDHNRSHRLGRGQSHQAGVSGRIKEAVHTWDQRKGHNLLYITLLVDKVIEMNPPKLPQFTVAQTSFSVESYKRLCSYSLSSLHGELEKRGRGVSTSEFQICEYSNYKGDLGLKGVSLGGMIL